MEAQHEEERQGQSGRDQNMSPVQDGILFQTLANEITQDKENHPQDQHGQQEKDGESRLYKSRPGIVPEYIQPEDARQSREAKDGDEPSDEKSWQAKKQGIQISLLHVYVCRLFQVCSLCVTLLLVGFAG